MLEDCIFCEIIEGKKPADFIYKGDSVVAFKDKNPHAPVHILFVPRKHIRSINDLQDIDGPVISEMILRARDMAGDLGIGSSGYKLVFNVERGGGQFVFHLHLHLVGGW
jgi:histidine triad (HIT) family protein